jgi:hypothetical protein
MSAEFTPGDFAALGLEAGALGTIETLVYPQPRVDDARGARPSANAGVGAPLGFLASQPDTSLSPSARLSPLEPLAPLEPREWPEADELDLLTVRSSALEDIGLTAALEPDLSELHLWSDDQVAFLILVDGLTSEWPQGRSEASALVDAPVTRVRLPLRQSFRCVIAAPDRSALALLQHRPEDLRVQPVYPWADPPIDVLMEQPDDAPLNAMTQERAKHADRWERTLILGMLARLAAPVAGNPRARLQAMMSGAPSLTEAPLSPRLWFGQLTARHRALIARRAIAHGQILVADLEDCRDALVPTNQRLAATWLDLCHRRDDLEGVRVLLRSVDVSEVEALETALRDVDAVGKADRFSWPPEIEVDDERLRLVALSDPGAWWGSTIYPVQLL